MAASDEKPVRRAFALGDTALTVIEVEASMPLVRGFRVSVNGLIVEGNPSLPQWDKVGKALRVAERGIQFAIGDFANMLEERFGEEAAQILSEDTGWSLKTLSVYQWVAARIPREIRRMDRLGISHHLDVAALTHEQQKSWLNTAADAEDEPWTRNRLKKAIETGDDAPPSSYWILVAASSLEDQTTLMNELEAKGRSVKAMVKRGQKQIEEP